MRLTDNPSTPHAPRSEADRGRGHKQRGNPQFRRMEPIRNRSVKEVRLIRYRSLRRSFNSWLRNVDKQFQSVDPKAEKVWASSPENRVS